MLLGTAFSTMTALLAVHGMATPGVLIGPNGVIAFAGGLGIPVGTGLLALTALPALRRTRKVKPLLVLQLVARRARPRARRDRARVPGPRPEGPDRRLRRRLRPARLRA